MTQRMWIAAAAVLALAACGKKTETAQTGGNAAAPAAETPGAGAPAAGAPASARPVRKAGLWEQTVEFGKMRQTSRICLDAATDEKLGLEGNRGPNPCSESAVSAIPGGYAFRSVCDMGEGGKVTSQGKAVGDFGAKYRVDIESTTTGAAGPEMNGVRKFAMDAEWKGPCPADMKPGDIALPNGLKINPAAGAKAK